LPAPSNFERAARPPASGIGGHGHDSAETEAAAQALAWGDLVILPTETVYGLAADAANAAAVARLFAAKRRPSFNPLITHVSDTGRARTIATLGDAGERLARAFWPGPLTIVGAVRDGQSVCDLARAGLDTVAVRVPANSVAQAVLAKFAGPIVMPSANRSGRPSPTTFAAAMEETGAFAALGLDDGPCVRGLESTVVAVLDGPPRLLRPGPVTREAIEALIGPLAAAGMDAARSPGRMARHYAPDAPVRLEATAPRPGEAFLAFGDAEAGPAVFNLSPAGDLAEAAANLFAFLRAADALAPTAIAVASIPSDGLGEAINDRLQRAAGMVG